MIKLQQRNQGTNHLEKKIIRINLDFSSYVCNTKPLLSHNSLLPSTQIPKKEKERGKRLYFTWELANSNGGVDIMQTIIKHFTTVTFISPIF